MKTEEFQGYTDYNLKTIRYPHHLPEQSEMADHKNGQSWVNQQFRRFPEDAERHRTGSAPKTAHAMAFYIREAILGHPEIRVSIDGSQS